MRSRAMGSTPLVWTVANNVPANNFHEFVEWSKTVPGKFNYGHAGPGSVSHLIARGHSRRRRHAGGAGPVQGRRPGGSGGRRRLRLRGRVVLAGRQGPDGRQARQSHGRHQRKALAGDAGRADAQATSATSSPTWSWNSGGASSSRRARRSRSGRRSRRPSRPPWRIPPCANGSPRSTPIRRSRPARRCRVKLENEINNWSKFIDAKGIKVEQ